MPSLQPADMLVGRVIAGKYLIESFIGGGAMGSVYRARQFALDKTVAIKVMRLELTSDRSFVGRFHREAKAASRLAHAHSIGVTDFGEESDGLLYIVMEFVAGRDLERIMLEDGAPLADERIVDVLSQVLSAVAVAHDHGIVHRDLKPENILIVEVSNDEGDAVEHVKVCDFGIASMRGAAEPELPVSSAAPSSRRESNRKLTAIGALLGTPAYMSPEQASGLTLDASTDIYSVGAILFELLTGRTVYEATTPEQMVLLQMSGTPRHPRSVRPCNEQLAAVCMRALAKLPHERYPSARAMRTDLRAALRLAGSSMRNPASSGADFAMASGPSTTQSGLTLSANSAGSASASSVKDPPLVRNDTATLTSHDSAVTAPQRAHVDDRSTETAAGRQPRSTRRLWSAVAVLVGCVVVGAGGYLMSRHPAATARPGLVDPSVAAPARVSSGAATTERSEDLGELDSVPERVARPSSAAPSSGVAASPAASASGAARVASAVGAASASAGPNREAPAALAVAAPAQPVRDDVTTLAAATAPKRAESEAPPAAISPPAPPSAAAPAPAEAKPFSASAARVTATVTGAARTSRAGVASLVARTSFDACYQDALRAVGRPEGGAGSAHLDIDEDGIVRSAQVQLPGPLASGTSCFAAKLRGLRVAVPDTGAATADVAFMLVPE